MGDDAILAGFFDAASHMGLECVALSGNPDETFARFGIPSVARREMKAVEKAIEASDALVFPGGSVFQDVTSTRSVAYYAQLVKMAKKAGKKVVLVGQGVGPVTSFLGKRMTTSAFEMADAIAVRDPGSSTLLRSLGIKKPIRVTADTAFLLPMPHVEAEDEGFKVGNMKTVGVSPKALGKKIDAAGLFGDFCRLVYQSGTMPVLVPLDRNEDVPLIQEISKRQGGKIPDLNKITSPIEIQRRLARMDTVVATRLHAGILAATVAVPPLMINYDPKVAAFSKILEIANPISIENLTAQRLFDAFVSFQKDRERNVRLMQRKRDELSKLARQNVELVRDTLGVSVKI